MKFPDVDNSTGNIKFIGNVVRGNFVRLVGSIGNVEAYGVGKARQVSEGNIILRRGMTGNNKGRLIAGGDIVAKYIGNSIVEQQRH